jgi:hypothetical protein
MSTTNLKIFDSKHQMNSAYLVSESKQISKELKILKGNLN